VGSFGPLVLKICFKWLELVNFSAEFPVLGRFLLSYVSSGLSEYLTADFWRLHCGLAGVIYGGLVDSVELVGTLACS